MLFKCTELLMQQKETDAIHILFLRNICNVAAKNDVHIKKKGNRKNLTVFFSNHNAMYYFRNLFLTFI